MKQKDNLTKLLNLNYLRYANKTTSNGPLELPAIDCNLDKYPDFIALYSEKNLYTKTPYTAVSFFLFDNEFDGKNGLYWAIYYNDPNRLFYYKERFRCVRFIILPDYSILGDVHTIENQYRLFKARIVGLWFLFEIGAIAIPNITFPSPTKEYARLALSGLENCNTVAISTKGHMTNNVEASRLYANVQLAVDLLPHLKTIIVYDVCGDDLATLEAFSYAISHGIQIIIPDNTLKLRNRLRYMERHGNSPSKGEVIS